MDRVTVVIRTLNEAKMLGRVLDALARQQGALAVPFIVDSGSTDETIAIARSAAVRVESLDRAFTFGGALNWAMARSDSAYVAFLSGHALPTSLEWLARLVEALRDTRVAGAFGRQVAHPGAFMFEAEALERAYPAAGTPHGVRMSNANAIVRRDVWSRIPFDERVPGGEDALWASRVAEVGLSVAYAPRAAVYHSHDDNWATRMRRTRREIGPLAAAFPGEYFAPRAELRAVAGTVRAVARDAMRLGSGTLPLRSWLRGVGYRTATGVGRVLGLRDARRLLAGSE